MKLIGITGKSGSGKRTLANLIGEHDYEFRTNPFSKIINQTQHENDETIC